MTRVTEHAGQAAWRSPRPTPSNGAAMVMRSFRDALTADGLSIVAEIKRSSPSRGAILPAGTDVQALARAYEAGGAACLSVLTDSALFGGSPNDLRRARSAVSIPVLRKDFLATQQDIQESQEMGADAVLLIMSDLGERRSASLQEAAEALEMDAVVEVRSEQELSTAIAIGARLIAVNQRSDPRAPVPTVDFGRATDMSPLLSRMHPHSIAIAASGIGITGGTPIGDIVDAGYGAALIGEALAVASDPAQAFRRLRRDAGRPRGAPLRPLRFSH